MRATAGIDASARAWASLRAHAVRGVRRGRRHFGDIEALLAALEPGTGADVTVLVKGSRFMRMERVVRRSPSSDRRRALMLLELAQWLAQDIRAFNVFNYITLRAVLACLTALAISFIAGPLRDPQADRLQDRPVGARRRPASRI